MKKIVQDGNPVLRKIAKEVLVKDIKTPKIQKVLSDMSKSLQSQHDGVAIAAPQIGYSLRIFAVAGKIFDAKFARGKGIPENESTKIKDTYFINPVITKLSKKKEWMDEGCLSVRPLWGQVERSVNATVEAYDENGKKFTRGAGGLLAHIFQHETDHLNGVLFIDKARHIREGYEKKDGEN
jgi:peptide deformylase